MTTRRLDASEQRKLRGYANAHCEESLAPDELRELQMLLMDSEEARSLFIDMVCVHTGLTQELDAQTQVAELFETKSAELLAGDLIAGSGALNQLEGFRHASDLPSVLRQQAPGMHAVDPKSQQPGSDIRPIRWRHYLPWGIIAAAVIATVVLPWAKSGSPPAAAPNHTLADQRGESIASGASIAKIVRKINCVWSDDAWALNNSSEIIAGQTIGLERGFMRLAFHNGVSVVLEGPVKFTAVNELHGALEYGGLGVRAPHGFSGYVVHTPTAKVTDLGTEFSLRVTDDGVTNLSVIEGEVEVSPVGSAEDSATSKAVILEKDDKWSSLLGIKAPQGSPSPTDFPTSTLLEDPAFDGAPELPVRDGLSLWLSADVAVKTDSRGGVVAWGDISSQQGPQRHSAWQVEPHRRPFLERRAIDGQAAIRFDGEDDCLVTEPFETGDAQTIALVGRLDSLEPVVGAVRGPQFINFNGPPNLVVEYDFITRSIRGRVFAGYGREPRVSGQARVRAIASSRPLAVVYTYDHKNNQAALYLNDRKSNFVEARVACASARPKVIGMHSRLQDSGLAGEIVELLIFDRSLDEREVRTVLVYFQSRYGSLETL